jgi:oligoendopeptidase F
MINSDAKPQLFFAHTDSSTLPSRELIDEKYKWDLTHIYQDEKQWEQDYDWVKENLSNYEKFAGKIGVSVDVFYQCLQFDDAVNKVLEKLHLYAMLSRDSDLRIQKYRAMDDRIRNLFTRVSAARSFIKPELLEIPEDQLFSFLKIKSELAVYGHYLNDIIRTKKHTLKKEQEEILALSHEVTAAPYKAYSIFTNSDLKFPIIEDEKGKQVEMSHARFYAAMYSVNRAYRERAFKSYLNLYIQFINTITELFNGNLKANIFNARARKYSSAREAALDLNNIPLTVYDNLIKTTNENLTPLHRWAAIKKKILCIDELHPYDVYTSLFSTIEREYSYEEATRLVYNSLQPLGEDYLNSLKTAFDNRWIDVHETQSKRSGAYSSGTTYGVHPYVLLNWTNLLNDVFTLAHEMGHNMHSYYTGLMQPYPYANYSIFLAEVASTFNESLLLDYLISNSSSKDDKLFLLEKYLNNITSTFYRQVMFAEFELEVYSRLEKDSALTADNLCSLYKDIYQKYWGKEMVIDREEEFTWARIPHFYYNYYVFQYATGFAASEALSAKVKTEGAPAVERYLNFLKAGSSDYPINILYSAGVDTNSSQPVTAVTQKMNNLLDQLETLLI